MHGNAGYTANCYSQPSSGAWHHLAVVFDKSQTAGDAIKFYLDGVLQTPSQSLFASTNTDTFGSIFSVSSDRFVRPTTALQGTAAQQLSARTQATTETPMRRFRKTTRTRRLGRIVESGTHEQLLAMMVNTGEGGVDPIALFHPQENHRLFITKDLTASFSQNRPPGSAAKTPRGHCQVTNALRYTCQAIRLSSSYMVGYTEDPMGVSSTGDAVLVPKAAGKTYLFRPQFLLRDYVLHELTGLSSRRVPRLPFAAIEYVELFDVFSGPAGSHTEKFRAIPFGLPDRLNQVSPSGRRRQKKISASYAFSGIPIVFAMPSRIASASDFHTGRFCPSLPREGGKTWLQDSLPSLETGCLRE